MPTTPPLSLQLYTVREALDADFAGTMQRVSDIGFTRVEPYDFLARADALATALAATGLTAPSAHLRFLDADSRAGASLDDVFATAAQLGIPTVIDPFVDPAKWLSVADIQSTADALNAAAEVAVKHGIRIGYHNHWFELESVIGGRTGLEILSSHLNPAVILELDTYWAAAAGQDLVALLGRLGDRVRLLHIKDGPIEPDPASQQAVGHGNMPVWEIIAAATSLELAVVELDDFAGEMFDAVIDSFAYLTGGAVNAGAVNTGASA
ncbi:sugar phosphate isomerase/epimerase family protein [Frigoribacterium sp. CG_9.8]|uniref:sugar phosphate isomerase/epimerase family protein n=1 Tax=Frigoribacterium sp. CG_9.8 TaxID=2787733 RepID=UPI001A1801EA|nr:sugar phosphate isomerase/epimerase [Frigoribacterium sp. CG_9.8]